MKITLPPKLKELVESKVSGGTYLNESELIADALRKLYGYQTTRDPGLIYPSNCTLPLALGLRLGVLKEQLAQIEVSIKELLRDIDDTEQRQRTEQDRRSRDQEILESVLENLNKAADSYAQILEAVGGLS